MFKDHFSDRAAAYAACRPDYPQELADGLADAAPGRGRAWDCGCGSGQLSVLLGARFDEVIATDASVTQLTHARPHARVRYAVASAEASALRAASADLVVAAQAAHWFDLPRFWAEAARVGRPGGVVAIVTYGKPTVVPEIDALVDRFYHDDVGRYWTPERRLVEEGYRNVEFPFDEIAAPSLTMRERWSADDFVGYVETWSAVRGLLRDGGAARLETFALALREQWGDRPRDVDWPLAMRVGRLPD